jgi:hypothetical protein
MQQKFSQFQRQHKCKEATSHMKIIEKPGQTEKEGKSTEVNLITSKI